MYYDVFQQRLYRKWIENAQIPSVYSSEPAITHRTEDSKFDEEDDAEKELVINDEGDKEFDDKASRPHSGGQVELKPSVWHVSSLVTWFVLQRLLWCSGKTLSHMQTKT